MVLVRAIKSKFLDESPNNILNTWVKQHTGWGNGYLIIPPKHIWYDLSKEELDNKVDVHGGITFDTTVKSTHLDKFSLSEEHIGHRILGFGTCHYGDNINTWNEANVRIETARFYNQAILDNKAAKKAYKKPRKTDVVEEIIEPIILKNPTAFVGDDW